MRNYLLQDKVFQNPFTRISIAVILLLVIYISGCKVYSFTGASIPAEIKTVRVQPIINQARYQGNMQLAPQLTEKLRQKILAQTKLTQVNKDDADYDISGIISQYDVTTSGISSQQVSTNRLNVGVTVTLLNRKAPGEEPKSYSISRTFDFSAGLTLQQAEQKLNDEMIRNLVDEIFNRIFSDW